MRAFVTSDYGVAPAEVDLPTPTPGEGEALVRIAYSSMNGFDVALAGGYFKGLLEHQFPIVLGRDFAGTVEQVGPGVTDFSPGDAVFGVVTIQPLKTGGFAEYVSLPQENLAHVPAGLDLATAGVVGLAGAAAVASVTAVAPAAGETVLISGATGGVGAFAIQLVSALGATVIATTSNATEADHVRSLGAHYVTDRTGDMAAQVREIAPGGVDVVLHYAGDPTSLSALLAEGGRFATLLMANPDGAAERRITVLQPMAMPHRDLLERLGGDIAAGKLRIPVQRTFTLGDVPQAFAHFTGGTLGKISISIA
jgi:NADPH:quinone reductase-like Zn-dependent oxidoreductase